MIQLEHEISHTKEGEFVKGDTYMTNADKREALLAKQGWRAGKFDQIRHFFENVETKDVTAYQNLLGLREIPRRYIKEKKIEYNPYD